MEPKVDDSLETGKSPVNPFPARKLPKIDDLYLDRENAEAHNELNILLNQPPKSSWLKVLPGVFSKRVVEGKEVTLSWVYLPIERVEWLLTMIYIRHNVEIKEWKVIANAVSVCVRVHVLNPVSNEWEYQDGVGAMDIQTRTGAGAMEFSQIVPAAIMKALPAAKSYAIKDACEGFGKLFGRDLNRADEIGYQILETKLQDSNQPLN